MKQYTVLLLYPDYISSDREDFMAYVEANNPKRAVRAAREEAVKLNDLRVNSLDDFRTIAVFEGKHLDVRP